MAYSEGEAVFFKKSASVREYVLHFANVLSGELAKPRRRPKVLKIFELCKQNHKKPMNISKIIRF